MTNDDKTSSANRVALLALWEASDAIASLAKRDWVRAAVSLWWAQLLVDLASTRARLALTEGK